MQHTLTHTSRQVAPFFKNQPTSKMFEMTDMQYQLVYNVLSFSLASMMGEFTGGRIVPSQRAI